MTGGKVRWDWTFEGTPTDNWELLFEEYKDNYAVFPKMKEALINFQPPTEYKRQQYELFKIKHPDLFKP